MNDSTTNANAGRGQRTGRSRHRVISAICLTALGLGALVATGPVEAAPALPATTTPSASVQLTFICKANFTGVTQQTGTTVTDGQYVFRVRHLSGTSPVSYRVAIGGSTAGPTGTIRTGEVQFVAAPQGGGYTVQPTSNWRNTSGGTASTNDSQPCTPLPDPVVNSQQLRAAVQNKGGIINVAAGTYDLSTELEFRRDGTKLIAVAGTAPILRYFGQPDTPTSRVAEVHAKNVVIDGFVITGGNNPNDDGGGGIEVESGGALRLVRSTITGNRDDRGAGILNEGTITIEDSTITGNIASYKGGGFLNDIPSSGSATITNSTIEGNRAPLGPGITSFDNLTVRHSTIVRNLNTSNPSNGSTVGGVQRYAGTFNVSYSIIGNNFRNGGSAAALDCGTSSGGSIRLVGSNLVSNTTGCTTASEDDTRIGATPVGPLQDNGGPTQTAAPLDAKAINAYVLSDGTCDVAADQRGTLRPADGKCDLGSFEAAPLTVTAELSVDTTNYAPLDPGTVEVGATAVPTNRIASELATRTTANDDGTLNAAPLRSIALRSIALRSITLEDIATPVAAPLRSIEIKANALRSIPLRSIPLRSIALRSIPLRSIPLRSIPLRSIPLRSIPLRSIGGWELFLQDTPFAGVPLQSITLEDIAAKLPADFTLESIDLSSTPLRSIALRSILLAGIPLRSIQPAEGAQPDGDNGYEAAWCAILVGAPDCTDGVVSDIGDAELWEAQVSGADTEQPELLEVPLSGLTSTALRSIDVEEAALRSIPLRSIPLRSIFLENTPLRSIPLRSIALRSIALSSIENLTLESFLTCVPDGSTNSPPCPPEIQTLGEAVEGCSDDPDDPQKCFLKQDVTAGQLLDFLGGNSDDKNLLEDLTLFDILLAFVPSEDVPWEAVDLQSAGLQNLADPDDRQPTFDYVTTVTVANGPTDFNVEVILPTGFVLTDDKDLTPEGQPKVATWCPGTTPCPTPANPVAGANPTYEIAGVESGTYQLRVPVRAGSTVGEFTGAARVTATRLQSPLDLLSTDVTVVQDVDLDGEDRPIAPPLADGDLQLGYIGGSGELDVYTFTTPANSTGASARILLSNIPEGVDYDLTVYGPQPMSLRGDPSRELSSLGDIRFDLDPDNDALPTDVVNDIAIDINDIKASIAGIPVGPNYALRDISSRRSNNDEEVTLPALAKDATYVVVVSGYFGNLSPEPYGLRVRLDRRTALPECPADNPYPATGDPTVDLSAVDRTAAGLPPVDLTETLAIAGANTLYVMNTRRLDFESPGQADDVILSIAATENVNGVNAGLLLVDELPAWDGWTGKNSCSPDARNNVVKAIGKAIDAAGDFENIVIVGGDGVIPMAAVPDLTEYSNESTFARDVLSTGDANNAVAGTIGSGYLLSDDPYATDAGISVLEGDHELYVPDRNIGRLVETAGEIIGQLDNFAEYGGKLDPKTFQAAVTGYDFLTDGAQAIAAELSKKYTVSPLIDDSWDKNSFLGAFGPTSNNSVYSPNAHYDFESLLPAKEDAAGTFTADQLVTTSGFSPFAPVAALGFTVGCHAGLSVSDVQLGLTALDWAQLSASNGSQWIAHTTYGYGDTEIVAYSEKLAALFAGNVADITAADSANKTSLGAAVRDAKQQYLAETLVLSPYDEKILQSWTYYGLPMYTIGNDVPPTLEGVGATALVEETVDATTTVADQPVADQPVDELTDTTTTDTTTTTISPLVAGIMRAGALTATATTVGPVTFNATTVGTTEDGRVPVSIDLRGGRLVRTDSPAGSYYSVDGNTTYAPYRPVQPLVSVTIPDEVAGEFGGFLITGLTSDDLPSDYVPFFLNPLYDNSVDQGRSAAEDGAFPATLQRIETVGGQRQLLVAAGQYQGGQRLFRQIQGELVPRPAGSVDSDAPDFLNVSGANVANGGGRSFDFEIETESDATQVVVVYREEGRPNWKSIELTGSAGLWSGSAPLLSTNPATKAEFFAQSVDAAGNVGLTSNKIENFLAVDETVVPPPNGDVAPIIVPGTKNRVEGGAVDFVETGAIFTITPSTAEVTLDEVEGITIDPTKPITVRFNEGAPASYNPANGDLTLDRGSYTIVATNDDISVEQQIFVDPDAPDVTFSRDTDAWTNTLVELFAFAQDEPGSGMEDLCLGDDCAATESDGVLTAGPLTIPAIDEEVLEQQVVATATDRLGNQTVKSTTVRIDRKLPTASVSVTPDANGDGDGDGIYQTASATFSCDDIGSGIASCELLDGEEVLTSSPDGARTTFPITAEGRSTISVRATDKAGNDYTTPEITVEIDTGAPTADLSITPDVNNDGIYKIGETPTATFSCDDIGSGVDNCELLDGDDVLTSTPDGTETPFTITDEGPSTISVRATDKAGNTFTTSTVQITIDTVKPTASLSISADANNDGIYKIGETPTATFSCKDLFGTGVASCALLDEDGVLTSTPDGTETPFTITDEGPSTISVRATDTAGNDYTTPEITVEIDTGAPTANLSITPDTNNDGIYKIGETATATFSCDDTGTGIDSCELLDGTTILTSASPYDIVTNGTRALTVRATDKAGNTFTSPTPITIQVDRTAPTVPTLTVTPDGNRDGIYNFGEVATATFSCDDVGSGVDKCELLDGGTAVPPDSAGKFTINTSTPGTKTLAVRATDFAGNSFTSPVTTLNIGFRTCDVSSRQSSVLPISTVRLKLCDAAGTNLSTPTIILTALAINGTRDPIVNFSGLTLTYRFTYNAAGRFYEYTFFNGGLERGVNHTLSFTTKQPAPNRNIGVPALNLLATNTVTFIR